MTRLPEPSAPRWISTWLALLPPLYPISLLALFGLRQLQRLPSDALWLLGFYALSQFLPAFFAPDPLFALAGTLLRTALMLGLIGLGAALRDSQKLWPLSIGLTVTYISAGLFSLLSGLDLFATRLAHPYMTSITLGLGGMLGILFSLFLRGSLMWRVPLGLMGLAVALLSGSRGALLATIIGAGVGLAARQRRQITFALLGMGMIGAGVMTYGEKLGISSLTRLTTLDTTGRDIVWNNVISVIRAHPIVGVGTYHLGSYLTRPGTPCALFENPSTQAISCPTWLEHLGNPWLIAHNLGLQQLAETGPLGLLGLLALITAVTYTAWRQRDSLSLAILSSLLIATINDNTLLIPSPFFGEVFWVVAGIQLLHLSGLPWKAGILGSVLGLMLTAPAWAGLLLPKSLPIAVSLSYFNASPNFSYSKEYPVFVQFNLPDGEYRASLLSCTETCKSLQNISFHVQDNRSVILDFKSKLQRVPKQRLQLQIFPQKSSYRLTPLAQKTWEVKLEHEE